MLTTPDDPQTALPKLRTRGSMVQGLLTGYYKLAGDRVGVYLFLYVQHCALCSGSTWFLCVTRQFN